MAFRIQQDGTVTDAAIMLSSQYAEADEKALKTIRDLRRLEPPPKFMFAPGSTVVAVEFVFDYEPHKTPNRPPEPPSK
jgi:TonB family protein